MEYLVIEDGWHPGDWRAELLDSDGSCYVAIFTGPVAEQRAKEYAAYKNGNLAADIARLEGLSSRQWFRAWLAGKVLGSDLHRLYHRLMRSIGTPEEAMYGGRYWETREAGER